MSISLIIVEITKYSCDPSFESLVDAGALSFLSASLLTFEYLIMVNVKLNVDLARLCLRVNLWLTPTQF